MAQAKQIAMLKETRAHLMKQLEDAKALANQTVIQLTEPQEVGMSRRRSDDEEDDYDDDGPRVRRRAAPMIPQWASTSSCLDEDSYGEPSAMRYRGGEVSDDDDDTLPQYRSLSANPSSIIASSTGPADEFDGDMEFNDEPPTYRGHGDTQGKAAAGAAPAKTLDVSVVQELGASFKAFVAQGSAADEKQILQQLNRVMEVLG